MIAKPDLFGSSLLVMVLGVVTLLGAFETGKTYHGFKLVDKRFVEEVNAACYYFAHEKSSARLLKIAADDPNKTFSIAFKTIPQSDCGTPHIMEHSVLNGSENFPVKSPFDVLTKGSLNTFLNAMTGSDITIYPVASMNDKDYFNLMHVYLDAVLNPLIYKDPRILKQEGWHHEMASIDGDVVYKGVVYNEMKGAFSSPTRELDFQIYKNLFPDNGYGYSSGGYPDAIPDLTYEAFLDFHKTYYHPDNSYIFLYGNADLDKELAFINEKYLYNYTKSGNDISIKLQKPFKKMKAHKAFYPVSEGSDTKEQTYLALNWVAGLNTDRAMVMGLHVLRDVLVGQESAPIRLALQEAGIGKDVYGSVDDNKQTVFQIVVQNANAEDKDTFYEIVTKTLQDVVEKGLDKKAIEGTINRMEFRLREGDDAHKGLTYNFQALSGWFFAQDPFLSLEYEKPLAKVKKALTTDYLESLISKYLLDNPHSLLMVLEPDPELQKENNQKVEAELAAFKAGLSAEEKEALVKETQALIDYQKREDTEEALATIPLLELSDINPKAEWYAIEETKAGKTPVLHYDTFTNNVIYSNLYFDVRVLPEALIPYAALLAEVLGNMNTENYTYGDLDIALNIHTGSFSTSLTTFLEDNKDENLIPKFVLSSKAVNDKLDKQFELINEILIHTKLDDTDRLKDVLIRHQSRLDSRVQRNGYYYSAWRLESYYNKEGYFDEKTRGLNYYWFVTGLTDKFDEKEAEIKEKLIQTAALLFNRDNLIAGVTCSANDLKAVKKSVVSLSENMNSRNVNFENWQFDLETKNEGLLTASKVQYVLQGYNFKKLGYEWNGKMRVLNQVLSREYLQNKIRVIGGAYGGFASLTSAGNVYFASYRDPNLSETLDNYDGSVSYIQDFDADEDEMTRFIIGTISRMDRPLTPSQQGNLAIQRYFHKTQKERVQKDREEVLAATPEDIQGFAKFIQDILNQENYCVYGNESKIQEEKDLFKALVQVNK